MLPFEWNYRRIVHKTYPHAGLVKEWVGFNDQPFFYISDNGKASGIKLTWRYRNPKAAWKEVAERLSNRPKMDGPYGFELIHA